jgi:hypothetical protein
MFSAIRKYMRVSPATVIASFALVFAMTGGAFAVSSNGGASTPVRASASLTPRATAAKSGKGARGPRGARGATGAKGATGLAGAPGAQGPAGAKGETGATGPGGSGESVTVKTLHPGEQPCPAGGAEFSNASGKVHACNGASGEEGTPGAPGEAGVIHPGETLPSGASETGTFGASFLGKAAGVAASPISFSIPLANALGAGEVFYVDSEEQNKENGLTPPSACQGTAETPTAVKGNLCVYQGATKDPEAGRGLSVTRIALPSTGRTGAGTAGAIANIEYAEGEGEFPASLTGAWAVTAG